LVVEVLVGIVRVLDACWFCHEGRHSFAWGVVRGRCHFSIHAVDFGFLDEHACPATTEHPGDAHVMLHLLLVGREPVAALPVGPSLLMPALEELDLLLVVVVEETLVVLVVGVIVDVFEVEQHFLGLHVCDCVVVLGHQVECIHCGILGIPVLDLDFHVIPQQTHVSAQVCIELG